MESKLTVSRSKTLINGAHTPCKEVFMKMREKTSVNVISSKVKTTNKKTIDLSFDTPLVKNSQMADIKW